MEEIAYRDTARKGLDDIIANIEQTKKKLEELEKADFTNPEEIEKANRSINVRVYSLVFLLNSRSELFC